MELKNKRILVTGGLGFIGSGICMKLLELGCNVISVDFDPTDSSIEVSSKLHNFAVEKGLLFENDYLDLCKLDLNRNIAGYDFFDAVIHCAAYKSIEMSIKSSMKFYHNNVCSTMNLINWCSSRNIKRILFSSTAAVYDPELWYCYEDVVSMFCSDLKKENEGWRTKNSDPYSGSKLICEELFLEYNKRCEGEAVIFRYFNPIGTYKGLRTDISDSMFGNGFRALEKKTTFNIFGNDYPTEDGTCLRDYVDLRDIIEAHIVVLEQPFRVDKLPIYNLGTGKATSVLDCCKIIKSQFPEFNWCFTDRRKGDSPAGIANCDKIYEHYGWKSKYSIKDAIDNYLEYK